VFNKLRDKKYLIYKVFIWLTYVVISQTVKNREIESNNI
jgi:hypothetical protein